MPCILLPHTTPDTFFQCIHPLWTLWLTDASSYPSSAGVDPRYLNVFTLFTSSPSSRITRSYCSLLLQYLVLFLLIFSPRSSIAFLHSSRFLSTSSLLVLHSTMSSANSMLQGGCSLMHRPSTSMTKSKRYGLSEDPWCSPTLTVIVFVSPTLLLTVVLASTYVSLTILTYFSGTPFPAVPITLII